MLFGAAVQPACRDTITWFTKLFGQHTLLLFSSQFRDIFDPPAASTDATDLIRPLFLSKDVTLSTA